MNVYRHGLRSLAADYARCGAGLAATVTPLVATPLLPALDWTLAAAALLFALHGTKTALRHLSVVECGQEGISLRGPIPKSIRWSELRELRLRYFSTRRDRERGWMQLVLKDSESTLRVESTLAGFGDIVAHAAQAAAAAGLDLSAATLGNLERLRRD